MRNPFSNHRVDRESWHEAAIDLTSLHEAVYCKIRQFVIAAPKLDRAVGILINGEPGSGKTHLLRRFCQSQFETSHCSVIYASFESSRLAPVVQLNNAVMSALSKETLHWHDHLRLLFLESLMKVGKGDGDPELWLQFIREADSDHLANSLEQILKNRKFTPLFEGALREIAFERPVGTNNRVSCPLKRLSTLPSEELNLAAINLLAMQQTVFLCLDHLETLISIGSNAGPFGRLFRFLERLFDSCKNVVVVTGMTTSLFQRSRDLVPRTICELLESGGIHTLNRVGDDTIAKVLHARLSLYEGAVGNLDQGTEVIARVIREKHETVGTAIREADRYWRSKGRDDNLVSDRHVAQRNGRKRLDLAAETSASFVTPEFDDVLLDQVRADTEAIQQILQRTFSKDERDDIESLDNDLEAIAGTNELESSPTQVPVSLRGFVESIIRQREWKWGDLAAEARRCGFMPGAAIQQLNDWAVERFGDLLILEDAEIVVIQRHLITT